jgi:hypothetical protein
MDFRVAKSFTVPRGRLQANVGLYNLFNANSTLTWNTRYGSSWLVPTTILQGRLIKFGAQLDF